jgi:hypothetical protein
MTTVQFLSRLDGVKPAGEKRWTARCPCPTHAHGDRRPSLSVAEGEKGIVLKCFAGCATTDIVSKLGVTLSDLFHEPRSSRPASSAGKRATPDVEYPYRDERGVLLFQVVRGPNKKFLQRRPDPLKPRRWVYKVGAIRRVLYRLPELLAADVAQVVFIVEGEKDVENLRDHRLVATTNPGGTGAGKLWLQPQFVEPLAGRHIVVLPDNDGPGLQHAQRVAAGVAGVAASVKVLELPALPTKGDVSDWLAAAGTRAKLLALSGACPLWRPAPPVPAGEITDGSEPAPEKVTQSQLLVSFAREHAELFRDDATMEPFATIRRDGHLETWPIPSRGDQSTFRNFLIERSLSTKGRAPASQALTEAIETLRALALMGSSTRTVALRVAEHEGRLFLDLGDAEWRVIEISSEGWRTISASDAPVRFRRSSTMRPLPEPKPGGRVDDLRRFVNTGVEEWRWRLMVAWLLFTFQPRGPFPALVLQGEQGSAKSTTARVLRSLIDPSQAELRMVPKDDDTVLVAAKGSWVLAYDNLSGVPSWLSDVLCCLATGTAYTKRAHYTNDGEHVIEAMRPVMVNGIDDMTARPDFARRAMAVELPPLADACRKEEAHFWREFREAQPYILGALCSTVSRILDVLDTVEMSSPPTMADFARWGLAAEAVLGWPFGSFLCAYQESQSDSAAVALEAHLVGLAVSRFMEQYEFPEWRGTSTDLLPRLAGCLDREQVQSRQWPINASQLGNSLRRVAPTLRRYGIETQQIRVRGERLWLLQKTPAPEDRAKPAPPPSPRQKDEKLRRLTQDTGGDAGSVSRRHVPPPDPTRVTGGDAGVAAPYAPIPPRWGDGGDGGDGAVLQRCEEREEEAVGAQLFGTPEASS